MKIKLANGADAEISMEEAKRISKEVSMHHETETNDEFLNRALNNIEMLTGERPKTEDELKKLLYDKTPNTSMKQIELWYEAMETITGWHSKKTNKSM